MKDKDFLKLLITKISEKHKVKIEDVNLHIFNNQLHVQEYTPYGITDYKHLEIIYLKK